MHILAWQSKVGFLPWMVPSTAKVPRAPPSIPRPIICIFQEL
jgi:protoheme ferro-lyase